MSVLDDREHIVAVDPSDALGFVERAAEQWAEGVRRARAASISVEAAGIRNVVVCGMGGSGISGDVAVAVAAPLSSVPVAVVKGYDLPSWVGPDALVVCASYSGNTEETLSCFEQARARGARIVAVTTGGALAELAASAGVACISPVEGLQPRAALYSLAPSVLVTLERLGVLPDLSGDLKEVESVLDAGAANLRREVPTATNEAKRLAVALSGRLPIVWGQEGILSVAAVRWRCQLNENAKMPAWSAVLPELDHNEIVGYDPGIAALGEVAVVVLRSPGEHPRIARRIDATLAGMGERVGAVLEATASGQAPSARLMSACLLGDFVSIYCALLRGADPTPVAVIESLKAQLASR
ncbi:MAG: bifunctional phosphoglucose/phosphomannose isomerase [Actinomycetota bacterium]